MRIVAGKYRGRKLADSSHLRDLRPTTDRNREALFNILTSGKVVSEIGFELIDANILDVCCGSGAVAFEALSRGAKSATLIDKNIDHLEIAKKTARDFDVRDEAKILSLDVRKLPENDEFFDLVFIDPPYAEDYQKIIKSLLEKNWIKKDSLVVIESGPRNKCGVASAGLDFCSELKILDQRKYGITSFTFLKLSSEVSDI